MSAPSSPADPLLVPPNSKAGTSSSSSLALVEKKQQTLGGTTYVIDPSKTIESAKLPVWKSAMKGGAMILATPVAIPVVVAYLLSMWAGPHWWRHKVIATLVGSVMKRVEDTFHEDRQELLKNIQPGDTILEVGAGPGYYLKYLAKKGCRVVALEPVENFEAGYRKLATEAGLEDSNVEFYACDIETYVRDHPDRTASFDWVICGNVLCEVDDQVSTLQSVNHLLKPGGHVYFSEHIGAPQGTWARYFQDCLNPWWRTVGAGCNCNRDSLANLRKQAPGWTVISWQYSNFKVAMGPFVLGLALKNA